MAQVLGEPAALETKTILNSGGFWNQGGGNAQGFWWSGILEIKTVWEAQITSRQGVF